MLSRLYCFSIYNPKVIEYNIMTMEPLNESVDRIMRSSYLALIADEEQTLINFIVFNSNEELIEINNRRDKVSFLNGLIEYFEKIEEFEKCQDLLELKYKILDM